MSVPLEAFHIFIGVFILIIGVGIGRVMKQTERDTGFFARVFADGKDLDTTISVVVLGVLAMIILNKIENLTESPLVFILGALSTVATMKAKAVAKELLNGNPSNKTDKTANDEPPKFWEKEDE